MLTSRPATLPDRVSLGNDKGLAWEIRERGSWSQPYLQSVTFDSRDEGQLSLVYRYA